MDSNCRAVIFDLDGTLLDTFPAIVSAWNAAFEPVAGRIYSPDEVISRFGPHDEAMIEKELHLFPEAGIADVTERYFAAYEAAHAGIAPFAEIPELLRALVERRLPLGVMTGKGRRATGITLRHFGWQKLFAAVVSGDEVSRHKPEPDGVLQCAKLLGVQPEQCLYVGDSPADIGAAENAGMTSVVAGWHGYYHQHLRDLRPDYWADTPRQLLMLVA